MKTSVEDCVVIELPKIKDVRGNLTSIEDPVLPFEIKRVYYLYDVPSGEERGGHAHKKLKQLIIALSGSFDIILDDGEAQKTVHLNRAYQGLYLCPMIWRELNNFSSGSVCLVIASEMYSEEDYFRDKNSFIKEKRG